MGREGREAMSEPGAPKRRRGWAKGLPVHLFYYGPHGASGQHIWCVKCGCSCVGDQTYRLGATVPCVKPRSYEDLREENPTPRRLRALARRWFLFSPDSAGQREQIK